MSVSSDLTELWRKEECNFLILGVAIWISTFHYLYDLCVTASAAAAINSELLIETTTMDLTLFFEVSFTEWNIPPTHLNSWENPWSRVMKDYIQLYPPHPKRSRNITQLHNNSNFHVVLGFFSPQLFPHSLIPHFRALSGTGSLLKHIWADVKIWTLHTDDLGQTAQTRWLLKAYLLILFLLLATEHNITKTRNLR